MSALTMRYMRGHFIVTAPDGRKEPQKGKQRPWAWLFLDSPEPRRSHQTPKGLVTPGDLTPFVQLASIRLWLRVNE